MNSLLSEFGFACKDGWHLYVYNPTTKLSSFYLYQRGQIVYREDQYSTQEHEHTMRIRNDFNKNCIDLPNFSEKFIDLPTYTEIKYILNNVKDEVLAGKLNVFVLITGIILLLAMYFCYLLLVVIEKMECIIEPIKNVSKNIKTKVK